MYDNWASWFAEYHNSSSFYYISVSDIFITGLVLNACRSVHSNSGVTERYFDMQSSTTALLWKCNRWFSRCDVSAKFNSLLRIMGFVTSWECLSNFFHNLRSDRQPLMPPGYVAPSVEGTARVCSKNYVHGSWFTVFCCCLIPVDLTYGPLTRYVQLRVAHAPGVPGTFSPPPTSKETAS